MPPVPEIRRRVSCLPGAPKEGSPAFRAAVLLLASVWTDKNIDRLSRITGIPRGEVARCARRLCDNGVWQNGRLVCSWTPDLQDPEAFWADVRVAEGTMCRQVSQEGHLEWALAGSWWKNFDLAPRELHPDFHVTYSERVIAVSEPEPLRPEGWDEEPEPQLERHTSALANTGAAPRVSPMPVSPARNTDDSLNTNGGTSNSPSARFRELFPDAAWMG